MSLRKSTMRTDPRFQKWCKWIDTILDDIQIVYFHRSMYDGLRTLVAKYDQQDKDTLFFAFLQNIFVDSLAMGIRRQSKSDGDSVSLLRLLSELQSAPDLVTREDYYSLWQRQDIMSHAFMARDFALFASQDASHIDPGLVQNDLLDLKNACDAAVHLADRRIAHRDKRGLDYDITLQQLLNALELVVKLAKKYYLLFTAKDMEMCPVPAILPWPRPWIDLYLKGT